MRFRILGTLEVQTADGWVPIGAAKWRAVLARLLLSAGQIVSTEALIDELWGDDAPTRATNLVSIYVLRLRRLIGDSEGRVLRTHSPGYQLNLGPDDLDSQRFAILTSQGREALRAGQYEQAAKLLADSLALWRDKALADAPPSAFIEAEAERLNELRLASIELRIEADIACGRHDLVIPELRRLVADQPLREHLWLLLMRALDGAGGRAQALHAYDQARAVISDQLGVDPGPELQQLFQHLLSAGPSEPPVAGRTADHAKSSGTRKNIAAGQSPAGSPPVPAGDERRPGNAPQAGLRAPAEGRASDLRSDQAPVAGGTAAGAAVGGGQHAAPGVISLGTVETDEASKEAAVAQFPAEPGPMQLPPDITDFTGREVHVEQLCSLLSAQRSDDNPGALPVALVAGAGGLGKTTLAIHVAHRVRSAYPDGVLYVDLLGASPRPLSPAGVLARFLRDLGVEGTHIPADEDERAAQYRTRLNGRRMLIVLDSARDAAQVRPLLPGSASCAVIVTSRSRLPDLVGGGLIHLDVLDDSEALALFSRIVGAQRTAAEPDATAELLLACAGLPLAIRICAARLASRSSWTIRALAKRIGDVHRRLDELKVGDLAVRASFEVSFASLPSTAAPDGVAPAHAFRMLGLWQGSSIALSAAAALLGKQENAVADALEVLVDAHLLESPEPDRYSFHDLLRVYAAERATAEEPEAARHDAVSRLLAWYLCTASAADEVVSPQRDHVPLGSVPAAAEPLSFGGVEDALEWCACERENLVTATRQAAEYGLHDVAWRLPVAMLGCFDMLSYRAEWLASDLIALASARAAGDRRGEAWVLDNLGMVCSQQRIADALGYFEQAIAIRREIGDPRGAAISANNLVDAYLRLGRTAEALAQSELAISLQRRANYRYGEGVALNNLGEAYLDLGRPADAADRLEQARSIFVEVNASHGEDYALHNMARAFLDLGRPKDAVACFQNALNIRRAVGDRHSQAMTLMFLGRAQRHVGSLAAARESWAHAQEIFDELGDEEQSAEVSSELTAIGASSA